MSREKIEECCDALAFDIDSKEGDINNDQVNVAIDEATREAGVDRTTFLKVFQDLYMCNPFVYTENARDDALDARLNGRGATAMLDLNPEDDEFDPRDEGLVPIAEGDIW